ncbi:MAG: prepilin-type N-terminal cleavage/methylation domain-containing protein [Bacilli bacterium]|nr:prepilin-type N-terminal cleavage/methylation domain-containing protein [Bacilli bacterium]
MQIQRRQKGFTLVELLVVIAIIAILATVSIIGYTQFIKRANMSADQQAVTQMNTLLEGLDVNNEPDDVVDLWTYLNETGLDAEDYKPLTKDHYFFWDKSINRILLVDKENKVIFPKAYAEAGKSNSKEWYTLSGTIELKDKPAVEGGTVEIASASDFITTVTDAIKMAGVDEMNLSDDVNMMGASHGSVSLNKGFTLEGNGKTLSNLVSTEYASVGTGDLYAGKKYGSALFGNIASNTQVVIKDITFDGLVMGSYDIGITGILVGTIPATAKLTLENVTFKNCTIYGQNKVGIIAGYVLGELILKNVTIENCVVNSAEGESGMIFGVADAGGKVKVPEPEEGETTPYVCVIQNTVVNNVEYSIHEIVTIEGKKYFTKVKYDTVTGEPIIEVKNDLAETGSKHTATTRCATPDTLGWFYTPNSGNYEIIGDSPYAARPAIEVTSIDQMNENNRGQS